ncbi:ArsR/SmtB family transcription factor [Brucella pseudogrignonensis]
MFCNLNLRNIKARFFSIGSDQMISYTDNVRLLLKAAETSRFLHALANESRLKIVCSLIASEKSVNDIADSINASQSATSQHLKLLRSQNIVTTRRSQQTIYYSISSSQVRNILSELSKCTFRN